MLTRNSRRALSEKMDNEGSPAKRRRVDLGSNRTIVKMEMSESTASKRKVKASQNSENCNPGPSTSRARILHRHSRQVLSEMINNKVSQEKKHKVERASKKNVVKKEISEPPGNEINIQTSPPKRRKVDRLCKKNLVKNETSEHLDNTLNINISSTSRVNKSTQRNSVKKENLPLSLSRTDLKEGSLKECKVDIVNSKKVKKEKAGRFRAMEHTINLASEKVGVKNELSEAHSNEINQEYSHNVENYIAVPSTGKAKFTKINTDVKEDILPISAEAEDNLICNGASLNQEGAIADNDESIVELDVPQKILEEVLLSSDDEDEKIETRKRVTTPVDHSIEMEEDNLTGNEALLNLEEAIADNDESIVEVEVPQKVVEEVLLFSDDEDEQTEARKRAASPVDNSLASGSSGSTSETRTSASGNSNIEIIKIEDPSPQSAITPKKKKIVLDPSILTPPTGNLQENAAKLWKCLQFLEQSDLNPEAKAFVPSPKVPKKIVDEPKPTDCIVCLEPRETTFVNLPCRHAVTCGPCSDQLELLGKDCPVCRTPIETRFQIYN